MDVTEKEKNIARNTRSRSKEEGGGNNIFASMSSKVTYLHGESVYLRYGMICTSGIPCYIGVWKRFP